MTKKLEEVFGLPSIHEENESEIDIEETKQEIQSVEEALSLSDKINLALKEVQGMEVHDGEMDEIAAEAMKSYAELMSLGMNMTDMAAGPVFSNAAAMLKIALEAKDSKVTRKLKQIDAMIKKANLDHRTKKADPNDDAEEVPSKAWDRNELMKMLNGEND